jgi:hypothetical protein
MLKIGATFVLCLTLVSPLAFAQQPVGHVLFVTGDVQRLSAAGVIGPLAKGDGVLEGDIVRTGPASHVQLVMVDEALVAIRAESQLRIAAYQYKNGAAQAGGDLVTWELIRGAFRSITGLVGKTDKANYKVRSHQHVIGIRGTDHEVHLLLGNGEADEAGTYDRVTVGGTFIETSAGRIDLDAVQVGFASLHPGSVPTKLSTTPAFMQTAFAPLKVDTGPRMREKAPSDEGRLAQPAGVPFATNGQVGLPASATTPVLPAQALGENAQNSKNGFGAGGRCGGPCSDLVRGKSGK